MRIEGMGVIIISFEVRFDYSDPGLLQALCKSARAGVRLPVNY